MMQLGIFAKTFHRSTVDETLAVISHLGLREVHFNLACAGLDTLPATLNVEECRAIHQSFARYNLRMCGISGTFNAIHPDVTWRNELTRRTCLLIERCSELGVSLVTLCTGTRDPHDMWKWHAANHDASAWEDLCATLRKLIEAAQYHDVVLGIEPEQANVIDSASLARRLLDELHSPHLKIVLDAANLLHPSNIAEFRSVLTEAIDVLGSDIVMAHAKDVVNPCEESLAVHQGLLDWEFYLHALVMSGFCGPLVMHGLGEAEVPARLSFLKAILCRSLGNPRNNCD